MNSKSISSLLSDSRIKAVTTPAPLLVLRVALILPYQTYVVLASKVPEALSPSSERVNSVEFLSVFSSASPLDTQSAFDGSPRYVFCSTILSVFLKVYVPDLQTGAGTQASREKEDFPSQPPRQ